MPNLRVAVTVGRIRELDRNEGDTLWPIEPAIARQHQPRQLIADQPRKKLVCHRELIVPTQFASCRFKQLVVWYMCRARLIDERVVSACKREMHLRYENVRIVSWVSDDRYAFSISLDISAFGAEQQLCRVVAMKQKWMPDRPVAVQAFEVQSRRARVAQLACVNAVPNGRTIGGDVMCNELTKEGPAGCLVAKRRIVVDILLAVAQAADASQCEEKRFVGRKSRQVGK
jgi:hypothetical protein